MSSRRAVAALGLSAVAFVALVLSEGYSATAITPTLGDRPTIGFGSTFHADGTPVKATDRTTPIHALQLAQVHIGKEETAFRRSLPGVALSQAEYDLYIDFVYQYGAGTWRTSSMRRHLLAGDYVPACAALLRYKFAGGYDCSTPGNRRCAGVWTRQLERHAQCMAAQ